MLAGIVDPMVVKYRTDRNADMLQKLYPLNNMFTKKLTCALLQQPHDFPPDHAQMTAKIDVLAPA